MENFITLVGPNRAVEILGVRLVGINAENGIKLLFTIAFITLVLLLSRLELESELSISHETIY